MLQMTDEMQALLWAVNYRLGQLRERLKWECIDATNGTPCSSDKVRRLEGNIGALEQVDRWIQGKEEMPSAV